MRRLRHLVRLGLATAALALTLLLGSARPAAADNCSGLSDCYFVSKSAVTVTVGIGTVATVLLLNPPVGGSADTKPLDPGDVPLKVKHKPKTGPPGPPDPKSALPDPLGRPDPPGTPDVHAKGEHELHRVKVADPNGTVVERPVKLHRPIDEEIAVRTKVRDAEQAVTQLPRPRQKAIFGEEALASGRDVDFKNLAAAVKRGASPEEWVRIVNPGGDKVNTAAALNAVDAALDKVPRIARPGGAVTADAFALAHGSVPTQIGDLHEIGQFLAKVGPGARGVVTVQLEVPPSWANAAPVHVGHAFNAGNVDGRVVFVDAQTGAVAATPHEIVAAIGGEGANVTSVQFVPTRPALSP